MTTVSTVQRYRNALRKARILERREVERFQREGGICRAGEIERECLIAAIGLAFNDGLQEGLALACSGGPGRKAAS